MKHRFVNFVIVIFAVILFNTPHALALGKLPEPNDQPRHETAVTLSQAAQEYYVGNNSYKELTKLSGAADISDSYQAMQNNPLFSQLHSLMADTHLHYTTYSGYASNSLAYFWNSTDTVSGGDSYVMFYSDVSGNADGATLNREHVWPKSRASFQTKNGGSDLHHLRPALSTVNSAKSDHTFGVIGGVYTSGYQEVNVGGEVCYRVHTADDLFECKDDVKGDVARILLYVYCRWEQPNLYSNVAADLLPAQEKDSTDNGKKVIESLDTLLSWCASDPVDTWEMRRNDLTEEVQGNRNVFIDYPELAWRLFDRKAPADMPTPSSGSRARFLGDADTDGEVTALDVTAIQRQMVDMTVSSYDARLSDVDGNGETEIIDATYIARFLAEMEIPYPVGEPYIAE